MTDRYRHIRQALEGLRERCAQEAERITARRRTVAALLNNEAVKPCEVAAAIRKIDVQQHYECAAREIERLASELRQAMDERYAAQAEARELRAELARVWEDRNRYLHAARCAYGLLWQELADTERVREARRLLLEALPDEERKCGIHYAMQRAGLTEAEIVAALSQPAEQHDPLAVSDHCGECSEPEPECVCDKRESRPLTFTQGVLCSLSILDGYGDSIAYREVANPHDLNQLWEEADEFDREHLARHGYRPTPAAQESE